MRFLRLMLLSSVLALAVATGACSNQTEAEKVPAVDLETGETKYFFSDELPDGWTLCSEANCRDLASSIPCDRRSSELCEADQRCLLLPRACNAEVTLERAIACAPSAPSRPADCPDQLFAECTYSCIQTQTLPCEQITDPNTCDARDDCIRDNATGRCERAESCPTPDLAEATDCPVASTVPLFDANGCLLGYQCLDECPAVTEPECASGTAPSRIVDERTGCVIGFICDSAVQRSTAEAAPTGVTTTAAPFFDSSAAQFWDSMNSESELLCDQLALQYVALLREAKACQPSAPLAGSVSSCTTTIPSTLQCGCPTYVNATATTALDALNELRRRWLSLGCDAFVYCAPIACYAPAGARCVADDSTLGVDAAGICQDL